MKIYTRKGDKGQTSLSDGTRVPKDDPRVAAYGDVDELNSFVGLAAAEIDLPEVRETLRSIQSDLFAIGAQLANPSYDPGKAKEKTRITEERVAEFERLIDRYEESTGPIKVFILPGGSRQAALVHVLRSVARRAERSVVTLSQRAPVPDIVLKYMNRVNDLFFAMARYVNHRLGVRDIEWK